MASVWRDLGARRSRRDEEGRDQNFWIARLKRIVKLTVVITGLVFSRRKKELCGVFSILVFSCSVIFNTYVVIFR